MFLVLSICFFILEAISNNGNDLLRLFLCLPGRLWINSQAIFAVSVSFLCRCTSGPWNRCSYFLLAGSAGVLQHVWLPNHFQGGVRRRGPWHAGGARVRGELSWGGHVCFNASSSILVKHICIMQSQQLIKQ